ncbi:hypothetical protein G7046_g978 [Stylonectria norvegica]|nr:hypothetical protein G7046_g978 [Stylonectria norvegica]
MAPSQNLPSDAAGQQPHSRSRPEHDDEDEARRDLARLDEQFPPTTPRRSQPRRSRTEPDDRDNRLASVFPSRNGPGAPESESSRATRLDNDYEMSPLSSRRPPMVMESAEGNDGARRNSKTSPDDGSFKLNSFNNEPKVSIRANVRAYWQKKRLARRNKSGWRYRMRAKVVALYQRFIIEGLLRQKPIQPSKDGRHIPLDSSGRDTGGLIDERTGKPYITNFIRSSRYTLYDFVPKQLIYQFSKLGNFYFLIMGILQLIPGLSTVGKWTTIAPLGVFVAFSMAKEGYDDYRRYTLDKLENKSQAWILADRVQEEVLRHAEKMEKKKKKEKAPENGEESMLEDTENEATLKSDDGEWISVQWQHIKVGDIIRLRRDNAVPTDVVLLHATGPNGIAYIETMALDGETNLKSKQACSLLADRCNTLEGLRRTPATIISEDPNLDLYSYDGKVTVDGETLPLSLSNVIYRGSVIRNTTEVIGMVINSGEECKIRMNANKNVTAKKPAMQSTINMMVLIQIVVVLMLGMGLTIGYSLWKKRSEQHMWFLVRPGLYNARVTYVDVFFGYLIMFNTLIPLSLYISLEIIKLGQLLLLQDAEMYDPVTDTPMVAHTTTILENLGQISYIFSDKTGTLTDNVMRFRKLSVAGVAFLHDMDIDRDEETKRKKIESTENKKGKAREQSETLTRAGRPRNEGDDDAGFSRDGPQVRPMPTRGSSTRSLTRWRSTVRPPAEEPDMKTEEMLEYISRRPNTPFSLKAKQFLLCIALCHTCLPEKKENGEIDFQAASPDELALVEAARDLGLLLIDRPTQSIKLQTQAADGTLQTETYQVLDVIEFSSKRKRMSIIIRMPDGQICLFCKGADNVLMSLMKQKSLAEQKVQEVGRRTSQQKSFQRDRANQRRSTQASLDRSAQGSPRNSITLTRAETSSRVESLRLNLGRRSTDINRLSQSRSATYGRSPRASMDILGPPSPGQRLGQMPPFDNSTILRIDESVAANDGAIFERCFQHIEDFATEGLRTLLYGYRYVDEDSYAQWKQLYREAETSLVDRQERTDEVGAQIEQQLQLAGATAIEDKLQEGVPDTIDKLRRANIKVWMLTGDKRETAINIGHSARVCKPWSEVYILDSTQGNLQDSLTAMLNDVCRGMVPHSVVVVDGQTLAVVDASEELAMLFYDLVVRVDSVICCRASPSQKANLVTSIRRYIPQSMTLAVGDGANDIGMIQASHVGVGISGREGLQAARISDFSIAQFRFLQKLLLVHGRWNYMRTGKYILATFWKEMLFFLVQAHFQRSNGYTGTSLYESWSLTVFNSVFTSLPVILLGIFERDLRADTLLAVPELYSFGQRGRGFSFPQFFAWMVMGIGESFLIWYFTYEVFTMTLFDGDTSLFAMGMVGFTVAVLFINVKLLILELHSKTIITFIGFFISVAGWFVWMIALSGIKSRTVGPYIVRDAFLDNFGKQLRWWTTVLVELVALIVAELVVQSIRRVYWPTDTDLMQRIEQDSDVKSLFKDNNAQAAENGDMAVEEEEDQERRGSTPRPAERRTLRDRVRGALPRR